MQQGMFVMTINVVTLKRITSAIMAFVGIFRQKVVLFKAFSYFGTLFVLSPNPRLWVRSTERS